MPTGDVTSIFRHHPPHGDQVERYVAIRSKALDFAKLIQSCCPDSREKSLAITNLQATVMWANASIAIHESNGEVTQEMEVPG
jgi:hypothetical protein